MKESLDEWNRIIQVIVMIITNNSRVGYPHTLLSNCVRECVNLYTCTHVFFLILKHNLSLSFLSRFIATFDFFAASNFMVYPFQDKHSSSLLHLSSLRDFAGRRSMSPVFVIQGRNVVEAKDESAENWSIHTGLKLIYAFGERDTHYGDVSRFFFQ